MSTISRTDASKLRQLLRRSEEARREHVNTLLGSEPLIAGSFISHGRRCGKIGCRCESGDKHYSKVLSGKRDGQSYLTHVRAGDEADVAMKATRYRQFRRARVALVELAKQTTEFATELQRALTEPYPPAGRVSESGRRGRNARQR